MSSRVAEIAIFFSNDEIKNVFYGYELEALQNFFHQTRCHRSCASRRLLKTIFDRPDIRTERQSQILLEIFQQYCDWPVKACQAGKKRRFALILKPGSRGTTLY